MPRLTYSFSTSFWAVPRICDGSRPWRPQATWYIATSTAAGALIVIDVDTSSSGIPSNIASTSDAESISDTHPADLAGGARVVGVEAHLGGQVERHRQRRLALADQEPEAAVGLLARAEARVLPDRPGAPGVHVAVDAAGIGIAARLTQPRLQIAGHVVGGGEGPRPVAHVLAPWPSASAPTSTTILPTCWFSFIS